MRKHGCERPYNGMQMSTWLLLPLLVLHFGFFVVPMFPCWLQILSSVLFGVSCLASLYYAHQTTTSDAIDEKLYSHLHGTVHPNVTKRQLKKEKQQQLQKQKQIKTRKRPKQPPTIELTSTEVSKSSETGVEDVPPPPSSQSTTPSKRVQNAFGMTIQSIASLSLKKSTTTEATTAKTTTENQVEEGVEVLRAESDKWEDDRDVPTEEEEDEEEEVKYCWVCQTEVYLNSMHCKYCDKCVGTFDHHCMWLNTCVGSTNYQSFFGTVVSLCVFTFLHSLSLVLYLVFYFTNAWNVKDNSHFTYLGFPSGAGRTVVLSVNIAALALVAAIFSMVLQLLFFHIELKRDNLTTYQYIMKDNQEKRDANIVDTRIRERRKLELAQPQTSQWKQWQYRLGAYPICTPCDPIRKMVIQDATATTT